jgi:hypothetical protein
MTLAYHVTMAVLRLLLGAAAGYVVGNLTHDFNSACVAAVVVALCA